MGKKLEYDFLPSVAYVFAPDSRDVGKLMMSLDRGQGAVNLIYCPEVKCSRETFS